MKIHTTGTGVKAEVPANKMPGAGHDRIPEFNGEHMWIVTAAWRVTPSTFDGNPVHLDAENLLIVSGVGCFWCEQEWSFCLASKACLGDASPGWKS